MIKPKSPEIGVQKVDERKRNSALRSKLTVKQLLDKYTSQKADNVFNRLRGNKLLRSPSRHGGHERWRENSFNRQPYFPMAATNWGCRPPVYPRYPLWGFSPWVTYPTGTADYFQLDWISPWPIFRPHLHEKRARFHQGARQRDASVIHCNDARPVLVTSNLRRRQDAFGYVHMGGKKFAWVPIRRENLARDDATCEKAKHGCTNDTGAEDAFMHAGLEANVCAHSEKEVVPASMASTRVSRLMHMLVYPREAA
jgi:hypothetical protein